MCGFQKPEQILQERHYPLPKIEHLLQRVLGASVMSFLDGFFGYNQVTVHPNNQENSAFTTP